MNYNINSNNKLKKYLYNLTTRVLISAIIFLSISIIYKTNIIDKDYINQKLFEDNIEFTKINNLYKNNFGKIIPYVNENEKLVFSNNDLTKNKYEKYEDGVKIFIDKNSPVSLITGGIAVFIGNKDKYNNTVIIQGNDGLEYWYCNLDNIGINLYEYIESDTIIGEAKEDYFYLIIKQDGLFIDYDKYIKEI